MTQEKQKPETFASGFCFSLFSYYFFNTAYLCAPALCAILFSIHAFPAPEE